MAVTSSVKDMLQLQSLSHYPASWSESLGITLCRVGNNPIPCNAIQRTKTEKHVRTKEEGRGSKDVEDDEDSYEICTIKRITCVLTASMGINM